MDMRKIDDKTMIRGTVKWFDVKKDFGFIVPHGGGVDVLLYGHVVRAFADGTIAKGAEVEFCVKETENGLQTTELISKSQQDAHTSDAEDQLDPEIAKQPLIPARVKWYDRTRGFGFAQAFGDAQDIFIHRVTLNNFGLDDIESGEAICLRCDETERGKVALQVLSWV